MEECANSISQQAWSAPIRSKTTQGKKTMSRQKWVERMDTDTDEDDNVDCWSKTSLRFHLFSQYMKLKSC
jgi:hypothetical protein